MIHEQYRKALRKDQRDQMDEQPNMTRWEELRAVFRESNLEHTDHIKMKVQKSGARCTKLGEKTLSALSCLSSPMMRLNSSPRWSSCAGLSSGFELDRRTVQRRTWNATSPYLVPGCALPDNVRKWDRDTVLKIRQFLTEVGIEIRRAKRASQRHSRGQ